MIDYSTMPLWDREIDFISRARDKGSLPDPQYCIVWEDPEAKDKNGDPDYSIRITTPSSEWLAMAMHGGILPPVEVYWALRHDEAQPGFKYHTREYLLHDSEPMPVMTEEEAMEYLVQKDIPQNVWYDYSGNKQIIKIVRRNMIPTDKEYRSAWRLT